MMSIIKGLRFFSIVGICQAIFVITIICFFEEKKLDFIFVFMLFVWMTVFLFSFLFEEIHCPAFLNEERILLRSSKYKGLRIVWFIIALLFFVLCLYVGIFILYPVGLTTLEGKTFALVPFLIYWLILLFIQIQVSKLNTMEIIENNIVRKCSWHLTELKMKIMGLEQKMKIMGLDNKIQMNELNEKIQKMEDEE